MKEDFDVTPLDIQQHQFSVRFRGFDIQEVDDFLEQIAQTLEGLYEENERLHEENQLLKQERTEFEAREEAMNQSVTDSEKRIEQMNEAARKSAEMIVADAENKAEQILNKASGRLAQVQEDIIQLKGQRIQFEVQLRSIIEAHSKLFDLGKNQMQIRDDEYEKARMLKNNGFSSQ